MKKLTLGLTGALWSAFLFAQTTYDTKSLVDSNNNNTVNSTSSVTTNNTNTNHNINSGTQTINNNNSMSGSVTYNNNNHNTGEVTYNNNNNSVSSITNNSTSSNINQNIQSGDMTNRNINDTTVTQKVIQPPPTAMSPTMMSGGNSDLCSTGSSASVQTQIFGVSSGGTVRDLNCERLKLSKTLYDMGMKVAAVSTMCQDKRVFDAMMDAGTPCPIDGKIGAEAKELWLANPKRIPVAEEKKIDDNYKKIGIGAILGALVFALF